MSSQAVDLTILDSDEHPVPGVVVRAYSEDGSIFYTQDISDSDGDVGFLLDSDLSPFQFRFFKPHWTFENPQFMEIVDDAPNAFNVSAISVAAPVPTDARLCTAYGFFRDITGRPLVGARFHFTAQFLPFTLDGDLVLTGHVNVTTDVNGYAQVNLVRNGIYDCTIQGEADYARVVTIPDLPNMSLPSLLLPIVDRITFDIALPDAMVKGDADILVTPTVHLTDGNIGLPGSVQWGSTDQTVLGVWNSNDNKVTIRAINPGTAQITAKRYDNTIIRVPDPGIEGVPHTVVVT